MFKKYREDVNPEVRLVFVSFLRNQHATGQMVDALRNQGVTDNIMQFKFEQSRPDLSKLGKLFGLLSSETDDFEEQVRRMETDIQASGIPDVFQKLCKLDEEGAARGDQGSGTQPR